MRTGFDVETQRRRGRLQWGYIGSDCCQISSHKEAAEADREYYGSLTPQQRVDLVIEMMENCRKEGDAAAERFERVYRIVKLSPR